MTDEWDTCDHQHQQSPRFTWASSPPTTYAVPITPYDEAEDHEHQALLGAQPTPTPGPTCCVALTGFYVLAGLLALVMVSVYPTPVRDPWEFTLLCTNLVFWCLAPVFQASCTIQPLAVFSFCLWLAGHIWLWFHLVEEGPRRFIFHYQKIAWVVGCHSIFLGLEAPASAPVQLGMVLSVASLSLLVMWSWALHG